MRKSIIWLEQRTFDFPCCRLKSATWYTLESEPFVDLPDIARQLNMRLHIHLAERDTAVAETAVDIVVLRRC